MKASQFLQGYNVYEFTFKNSSRIHYAIAKTKKSLIEYYSEDITDPILKNDIKIDDSLSFADVIPTEKKHGYFSPAKKLEEYLYDFDIHFNDSENSNNKGFSMSLDDAKSYIEQYNGTNESYFKDYKGGIVSIVNVESGETFYEEEIF